MDTKINHTYQIIEATLEEMIHSQKQRVQERASKLHFQISQDDLLQPHDIPELNNDPLWNYEDGFLAGLQCAQIVLRRELKNIILK